MLGISGDYDWHVISFNLLKEKDCWDYVMLLVSLSTVVLINIYMIVGITMEMYGFRKICALKKTFLKSECKIPLLVQH